MDTFNSDPSKALTLEEKASLTSGKGFWHLKAIDRLNIPSIMVSDGPHGLRKSLESEGGDILASEPATCFPTASALASTWDEALIEKVGKTIGIETKSKHVSVLLGPGANIKRHPYCGRNFEYFSEDPLLSGKMAASFIKGVQSKGVATALKHFVANNQETNRLVTDAVIDERTLREIYLKSFEIALKEGDPASVMTAYNKVNGTYMSENGRLVNSILRDEWNFQGVMMTDWGGCNDRVKGIRNGQDLQMPGTGGDTDQKIVDAIKNGSLKAATLDKTSKRLLSLIDRTKHVLDEQTPFDKHSHHEFAKKVAAEGMVLLKNDHDILPLDRNESIALIGDFAKHPRYQGSGSSQINPTRVDTALDAFEKIAGENVTYVRGFDANSDEVNVSFKNSAENAARSAHKVVLMLGLPDHYESEGFDRTHLSLPKNQLDLIELILSVNKNVIVTLSNGAPVALPFNDEVPAILETYLSGQAGGAAMVDILYGEEIPGGKLAETFPEKAEDLPSDTHFPGTSRQVLYKEGPYIGYRYYETTGEKPLYPFGHGLSYASFKISDVTCDTLELQKDDSLTLSLSIENTGRLPGKETVQIYAGMHDSKLSRPAKTLIAFKKVTLDPQKSTTMTFTIPYPSLEYFDVELGRFTVEDGLYLFMVSTSSSVVHDSKSILVKGHEPPVEDSVYKAPGSDFNPSEEAFVKRLGHAIPKSPHTKPYHYNSTLGELSETLIGKILRRQVRKKMR
ncbi:MAG: beta-glucosidase, partial [Bacillota bacterium]